MDHYDDSNLQEATFEDYKRWCRLPTWDAFEAFALISGIIPPFRYFQSSTCSLLTSPFKGGSFETFELFRRSISTGNLRDNSHPRAIAKWAKDNQIALPATFEQVIYEMGWFTNDLDPAAELAELKEAHQALKDKFTALLREHEELKNSYEVLEAIIGSEHFSEFLDKTRQAVEELPSWTGQQAKIQSSGNLRDWVIDNFEFYTKEVELVKKILKNVYPRN